jgi:hypothetical protein
MSSKKSFKGGDGMGILSDRFWLKAAVLMAIISIMIVILGFMANCQASDITWHQLNDATVGWDAVTTFENGSQIPDSDIVKYMVFVAEPGKKDEKQNMGETELIEFKVGVPGEGKWFVGVMAIRYRLKDGEITNLGESVIAWSDLDEFTNSNPFGIEFYFKPAAPLNLRKKGGPL